MALPKKVLLVSKHFGPSSGGEAIKGFQFAAALKQRGIEVTVLTHQRALTDQGADQADVDFLVVPDGAVQKFFWQSGVLRPLLDLLFHIRAKQLIQRHVPRSEDVLLHYISPVSPASPRLFPKGYRVVLGPLTGNIHYPPALRFRTSFLGLIRKNFHHFAQRGQRVIFPEKRYRVNKVLVSGYERTRQSLHWAGVSDEHMVDVIDSGVSDRICARPRIRHEGRNTRFVTSGRMVDHKATDLSIRAIAAADPDITLDVFGDGEKRRELEHLVRTLKLENRVHFKGWLENHDALLDAFGTYRGYLFPSLAEANGIVMQEAMMMGLPVIATRWGGPAHLATSESAVYIEPRSEAFMIKEMAKAMNELAANPMKAESLSQKARARAEADFTWASVSKSWFEGAY